MREITETKTFNVYKYEELSSEAKERVKQWLLDDDINVEIFTEDCLEYLSTQYPNSNLKVQYSLNYCQGDGFNVYGDFNLADIGYENHDIKLPYNNHYCFCLLDQLKDYDYEDWADDYMDYFVEEDDENYDEIKSKLIEDIKSAISTLADWCDTSEKQGYKVLYELSDEEAKEQCNSNDWEFLEDGTLY